MHTTTNPTFTAEVLAVAEDTIGRGMKPWPVTLLRDLRFTCGLYKSRYVPRGTTVYAYRPHTTNDLWDLTLGDEPGWYSAGRNCSEFEWQD